jgi:hypothetical protein
MHLASLGKLESDNDITEMAKRMAARTQADGRVYLGTVVIKQLRLLTGGFVIIDRREDLPPMQPADFVDHTTLDEAAVMKGLRKERAGKEPSVTVLGKFDPDDFDMHDDAFLNLMSQTFGVLKDSLPRYIVYIQQRRRLHSAE